MAGIRTGPADTLQTATTAKTAKKAGRTEAGKTAHASGMDTMRKYRASRTGLQAVGDTVRQHAKPVQSGARETDHARTTCLTPKDATK